jgi:hypothetical protein
MPIFQYGNSAGMFVKENIGENRLSAASFNPSVLAVHYQHLFYRS